jgi:serine/threonine protein phosphatase PrpC
MSRVSTVCVFNSRGSRPVQEDFAVAHRESGVFALADGFGGPVSGVQAAKTACEEVRNYLIKEAGDEEATMPFVLRSYLSLHGNVLFNAMVHANQQLMKQNKQKNVHEKGGASVLAAYLDGDLLALANVGVCDAWLFREGNAVELVVPRSYSRLRDPFGREARLSETVPLMALGMSQDLEPEINEYRVRGGDWLLLHTDGLSAEVWEQVRGIQMLGLSPQAAAEQVTQVLEKARFNDNVSILLAIFNT